MEHWFAGSGARKSRQELEGSALDISLLAFQGSQVSLCSTIKKARLSVKYSILEGKIQIIPWQGVFFFNQHCFTKVIDTFCRDEKHGKQLSTNTIGQKKKNTFKLVTENKSHGTAINLN